MPMLLVALWAFAEATLFFIVADVPISAIALRYGVKRGLLAALIAAVAAVPGGLAMLAWAANDPASCLAALQKVPGIGQAAIEQAAAAYQAGGMEAMLKGAFSGVPYKLYAYGAGTEGAGIGNFALDSLAARLPRFALVAIAFALLRKALEHKMSGRTLTVTFVAGWGLFYTAYFSVVGI
jgi:hypothetical protein